MKRLLTLGSILVISLTLAACDAKTETPAPGNTVEKPENPETSKPDEQTEITGLTEPIAEKPVLVTSAGQSADIEMVKVLLEKGGIESTSNTLATSADLEGIKTLVLAVGGSSKGLGAAGIDAEEEIARVKEITTQAKEDGIIIIAVHIGGDARRGDLSDKFIAPSFANADYVIIAEAGNQDNALTDAAMALELPVDVVASMADAVDPLSKAFK